MTLGGEPDAHAPPTHMDHLGDFTALPPPAGDSQQLLGDSFASSLQCSADPNAFAGFRATVNANDAIPASVPAPRGKSLDKDPEGGRLRLALDLDATVGTTTRGRLGFRPVSVSVSQLSPTNSQLQSSADPYHDIFGADTQDEDMAGRVVATDGAGPSQEGLQVQQKDYCMGKLSGNKRLRLPGSLSLKTKTQSKKDLVPRNGRVPSPPPTLLMSMESARRARKQQNAGSPDSSKQPKGDLGDDRRVQQVADSEEQRVVVSAASSQASKSGSWDWPPASNGAQRPSRRSAEPSLLGSSAFSDFSEDLAPHCFQVKQSRSTASGSAANGSARRLQGANQSGVVAISGDDSSEKDSKADDSERETCDGDAMESCTQPLEPDEGVNETTEMEAGNTTIQQHKGARVAGHGDTSGEYLFSDTGTQPYGLNATLSSDDTGGSTKTGSGNDDEGTRTDQRERTHTPGQTGGRTPILDEVFRETCSSTATYITSLGSKTNSARRESVESSGPGDHPDFLTPRASHVLPLQGVIKTDATSSIIPTKTDGTGLEVEDSDDERDGLEATQPSDFLDDDEMAESPCELESKRRVAAASGVAPKSSSAMRNLEFSFTNPESEGSETQLGESISGITVLSSKSPVASTKNNKRGPFELSVSPVWPPTPSQPSRSSPPRSSTPPSTLDNETPEPSDEPSASKTQSSLDIVGESASSIDATPPAKRRRKRSSLSPDANETNPGETNPETPRPPVRRSTRFSQSSTPSSTPTLRPHPKIISPVPSQRTYASRSGTLFTHKFEFCLTGFAEDGGKSLIKLIKGHGGKITERYQDVLHKNNPKAVVIATPMSWRKRKFMQAVACGIPVVHPEWIRACIKAGSTVSFDGYHVPSGYSVTTQKFECLPVRELNIFAGYSFGIVGDASQVVPEEAKDKANLYACLLKSCGADAVYKNLNAKSTSHVDIVLSDEYTQTCRIYKKRHVPVKDFQWVTECMILQRFLDPNEKTFEPQRVGRHDVLAASARIGDNSNAVLKLHTGELVHADLSGKGVDHYLIFNVCEILGIRVTDPSEGNSSQSKKRKDSGSGVMLHVGVCKRLPYSAGLSKIHSQELDIPSTRVKRRVVAVSKADFDRLAYRDESIFYFDEDADDYEEEEEEDNKASMHGKLRLSQ